MLGRMLPDAGAAPPPPPLCFMKLGLTDEIDSSSGSTSRSLRKVAPMVALRSAPSAGEANAPRAAFGLRAASLMGCCGCRDTGGSLVANCATSRSTTAISSGRLLGSGLRRKVMRKSFSENSRVPFLDA